jgi:large subunit ribosomal protein L19
MSLDRGNVDMSLKINHKGIEFGIGDKVKVYQRIKEGEKGRTQIFEGMVIAIKNSGDNRSFTVRRIGTQQIGIERIFPLFSPFLEKVEIVKKGVPGVRRAKLYYTREKSPKVIEGIYSRAERRISAKTQGVKNVKKRKSSKSVKASAKK